MCRQKDPCIKENPEIKISEVEEKRENGISQIFCRITAGRFWMIWCESSYGESSITSGNKIIENKEFKFYFPADAKNKQIIVKAGGETKFFSIVKKD